MHSHCKTGGHRSICPGSLHMSDLKMNAHTSHSVQAVDILWVGKEYPRLVIPFAFCNISNSHLWKFKLLLAQMTAYKKHQ